MKHAYCFLHSILLLFAISCTSLSAPETIFCPAIPEPIEAVVVSITQYGNLRLDKAPTDFLENGYAYGDLLDIQIGNELTITLPFCSSYSDVAMGEAALVAKDDEASLAIFMNDFASTYGIATKTQNADDVFLYVPDSPVLKVVVSMKEKEGYLKEYLIHNLTRTNNREDYASDVIFANFRAIHGGELGKNCLYRASSPINPKIGRSRHVDMLMKEHAIVSAINLSENQKELQELLDAESSSSPYYASLVASGNVLPIGLALDFKDEVFARSLADGLRFLSKNEGPYLLHCVEGKDRTGFVVALLEALMGIPEEDIIDDYMITYSNFYGLEKGSEKYESVKNTSILPMLRFLESAEGSLKRGAECYILKGGLSEEELKELKEKLSQDY